MRSPSSNADAGIYYYTTYENPRISAVDMYWEDLDSGDLAMHPLVLGQHILMQN